MAKKSKTDELIQQLVNVAQKQKIAIEKAEKPNWLTNSSFSYDEEGVSHRRNIRVVNDVAELVKMQAFLNEKKQNYDVAAKMLGYEKPFTWLGFSYEDWSTDFKVMATKINITKEKEKLEAIESKLDTMLSPERKKEMELEAISKELGL